MGAIFGGNAFPSISRGGLATLPAKFGKQADTLELQPDALGIQPYAPGRS
jgi:hypothetical protein